MQDAGGVSKPLGSAACIVPPEKRAWYMPGPLSRLSLSSTSIDESTVIQLVRSLIGACKWVVGEWWTTLTLQVEQHARDCCLMSSFPVDGDWLPTSSKARLSAGLPQDSIRFGCQAFLLCIPQQFDLSSRHMRPQPVVSI